MRRLFSFGWLIALAGANMVLSLQTPARSQTLFGNGILTALPFQKVHINDDFWNYRIAINRTETIDAVLHQCKITGRIRNFAVAAELVEGKHRGRLFDDSDVYKVLEGIAYTLSIHRDAELEKRSDALIDKIAAAQQPDGYLNTYYTLVKPQERWKNMESGHELYCTGHLIEAAIAYRQATGKSKLFDVAVKLADHIDRTFGPGKKVDTSGHEEIELALVKLYRTTKQERYLKLAQFFLDMRGRKDKRRLFGAYTQDDKPVRQQKEVAGHAVRAMYLYCGMADVAGLIGDRELLDALTAIWHDVVERKMYVTGGIGPSAHNEGFTVPYDLPNDSAYAETCAAIGMALWNHRMFLLSGDGKYADVLEREVYNGLLSGMSLSGDHFFYVNPLASIGRHHRTPWFDCACCPTNIVRYIPSIGERVWAHRDNAVWSVLYMGNTATVPLKNGKVRLIEKTRYPWEGVIEIAVEPAKRFAFEVHLRIPSWCRLPPVLKVNGEKVSAAVEHGYVRLSRTWKKGDVIHLFLPMPVERVYADPRVQADRGRVALQRGPVVYCLEGVDHGGKVRNLCLPKEAKLTAKLDKDVLPGLPVVTAAALSVGRDEEKLTTKPIVLRAVPYFAWGNREPGEMIVWIAEDPEHAELPVEDGVVVDGVRIRASHLNPTDTLETLNDERLPKSSKDHGIRRMTWWEHKGSVEWLSYRTAKPRKLSAASVYWFDDTGTGGCRVPAEWRLLWLDGDEWKPVKLLKEEHYGTALDRFNKVSFEPVTTRELRLEVKLKPGYSGGVLRWRVKKAR